MHIPVDRAHAQVLNTTTAEVRLAPAPGSVVWRRASERRVLLTAGYALVLHERFGLAWSRAREAEFAALARALRAPLLGAARIIGPADLRLRGLERLLLPAPAAAIRGCARNQ
jgi:hypothetical protein